MEHEKYITLKKADIYDYIVEELAKRVKTIKSSYSNNEYLVVKDSTTFSDEVINYIKYNFREQYEEMLFQAKARQEIEEQGVTD